MKDTTLNPGLNSDIKSDLKYADTPKKFWRSLDELAENKNAQISEFQSTPMEEIEDPVARRDFLKIMGAGMALTSMSCIRKPVEKIVPYANRPEEIEPGIANYYTSFYSDGGEAYPVVVKTREGKPIYIKGNDDVPGMGGMTIRGHAHVLDLYDPDRLQGPMVSLKNGEGNKADWETIDSSVVKALGAGGVRILTGSLASPTTRQLIRDFTNATGGEHMTWDALGAGDVINGQRLSYGSTVVPRYRFDKADYIVSVGADFLGTWLLPSVFSRQFSKKRTPSEVMNRLVVFESLMTLTGSNADTRLQIKPSQYVKVLMGLGYKIVVENGNSTYSSNSRVKSILESYANVSGELGIESELFDRIAADLWTARGRSLVVAGGDQGRTENASSVQIAANFLNSVLGNEGETVDGTEAPMTSYQGTDSQLDQLINDINSGSVKTLIIHSVNPVAHLGKRSDFVNALKKVDNVIYTGRYIDETAKHADVVAPDHHPMENWGDGETFEGLVSVQQPTLRPLYNTRAFQDSLITWGNAVANDRVGRGNSSWVDYLKANWRRQQSSLGGSGSFDSFWVEVLHKGYAGTLSDRSSSRVFRTDSLERVSAGRAKDVELVLYGKAAIGDGSSANNAWLQELPDPVTKVVWDNYVVVSPQMADGPLGGAKEGTHVEVKVGSKSLTLPIVIVPGTQESTVGIALGYGRKFGRISKDVGQNAFELAINNGGSFARSGLSATVNRKDGFTKIANVQGHHKMLGRQIVVQATLNDYLKDPSANIHRHKMFSLWPKHEYKGHRWAMTIDLNACTGCSSCVMACQSENNVPTVGKKYILQGREMHWIRVDRYYTGDEKDPGVVFQPMTCQHCENASCETVCPVNATVHGEEGINQMAYNRCVGTRYCSNNCPYKVRRFNWFNYSKVEKPLHMALNPDVTVRSRGVMEKCTFCYQRIQSQKVLARRENRSLGGDEVVTACQESCPTNAITFGDVNNPESKIAAEFKDQRTYSVLEEYNNIPMVRYKSRIKNSNELKADSHGHGGHA